MIDTIESIGVNFENLSERKIFMKEQFVEFDYMDKIKINFKECHVSICPNGGLIAICKKKFFFDIKKGTKINDFIIVMHQNEKKKYLIPINWNYKERWIVTLDFNDKEQLYAICNDGYIYKIDILTERAVPKKSSEIFINQNIIKAKLIEDGFVALTVDNNFYYAKDIKNPVPKLIFPMSLLEFSNNVDFLLIPSSQTKSKKLELIITNDKGNGIIHIEVNEEEGKFNLIPKEENSEELKCEGVSLIEKDEIIPYIKNFSEQVVEQNTEEDTQYKNLGKIVALALSPKKDKFALYNKKGSAFIFKSDLNYISERKHSILEFDKNEEKMTEEEQSSIKNFEEGSQFLFCGEDILALCGLKFIILIDIDKNKFIYKINEDDNGKNDAQNINNVFFKCISEVDGLRFLTNNGIYFISEVPNELYEICSPFSVSSSKKLLKAYQDSINKVTNSEKSIREIKNLPNSIYKLQIAAANIFWTKVQEYEDKKESQLFLLQAAQHAKGFVKKDTFNFDKFYQMCKDIRTINNLRNHSKKPKLITYNEYKNMEPKDLIKKLIRNLNFGIAFKISEYLEEDIKLVYEKYAIACIKKIANNIDVKEEEQLSENLNEKLKQVKNFSFINLAKKAFKYNKDIIGMKFLENEKSILARLPKYIDKGEWDKVLELCENILDFNILISIFEKILKKTSTKDFVQIVGRHPNLKTYVIEYMNKYLKEQLDEYMNILKLPEETFFYALEQYFETPDYNKRIKYISLARENEKLIDNAINPNFDHKFYKTYLDSLERNLSFKVECLNLDKTVIPKAENTSFDISIYDTYKYGVKAEKYNWIESQNKHFNFSPEGMAIMKIISYSEIPTIGAIEALVKKNKNNLKKINLTYLNLADIYYNCKSYDNAAECIKLINGPTYFDYRIEMLKFMDKPEVALEIIITNKSLENMEELVKEIIKKKPKLLRKAKDIAEKNKVILNLE